MYTLTCARLAVSIAVLYLMVGMRAPVVLAQSPTFAASSPAASAKMPIAQRVSVRFERTPLRDAVEAIVEQSGITLAYSSQLLPAGHRVTYSATNADPVDALRAVLANTDIRVERSAEGRLKLVGDAHKAQESGAVTGRVLHAKTKQPVANATITIDEGGSSVTSGADGRFRVPNVKPGTHIVRVRVVGFTHQSRTVTIDEGKDVALTFELEPSTSVLNEVVVTGTVVATERKAITTPITVITADDIQKRGITRIEQFFRGEIPGVIAPEQGTEVYRPDRLGAGSGQQVFVRGSSSLPESGTSESGRPRYANPLKTYVDGVEIQDPTYLGTIDPQSIERIEIITGPQAATIYGSGAMGGVMQVFTKKGNGRETPDVTLSVTYGLLENNFSQSRAPSHSDVLTIAGGTGPVFSYSGNLSYLYVGQWQPGLFNRRFGASGGVTHRRGAFSFGGSALFTTGSNGTTNSNGVLFRNWEESDEFWSGNGLSRLVSNIRGGANSQTFSFNVDYQPGTWWQHHLTAGRSQNDFDLVPQRPEFRSPSDTLFQYRQSNGRRTSANYSTTIAPPRLGIISQTLTAGIDGSYGVYGSYSASAPTSRSTALTSSSLTRSKDRAAGGFASWHIGFWDQLFLTFGVRGERNPNYGREHAIDWTPTHGAAYTIEKGDVTLKLLASYGRATRAPRPDARLSQMRPIDTRFDPSSWETQRPNPDLTPEYSRGTQGGFELYYGNIGSVTVNRYEQRVSDLIQAAVIDSVMIEYVGCCAWNWPVTQNQNVASIRQHGWESTGSLNLGRFTLKGTYSWNDSRIVSVNTNALNEYGSQAVYYPGQSFLRLPTHTGNVTVNYARGGTSLSLVTNYVGQTLQDGRSNPYYWVYVQTRLRAYSATADGPRDSDTFSRPGYVKSDLAIAQRLLPWLSGTINMVNLGNAYGSENTIYYPTLGRQTSIGLSVRYPTRR